MNATSASGVRRSNENRSVAMSVSEWMRWNDIAASEKRLPPPLDVGQAVATATQSEQPSSAAR